MSRTRTCFACALSVFLIRSVSAQSTNPASAGPVDSLGYFPMSIGNTWTYGAFRDTADQCQSTVFDTARVNGKLYYLHSGPTLVCIGNWTSPVDSLRSDSLGRIWRLEKAREYMLFDFSHGNYPSYTTYPEVDTVRVLSRVDTTVPAGHFTSCVDLFFRRSFYDESIGFIFAPGVGIVQFYGPFYGRSVLLRAEVGGRLISAVRKWSAVVPSEFHLAQNYPNPFNPSTVIGFGLPHKSAVQLTVYNTLGQQVAVLQNGAQEAGYHELKFDGTGLSSGVYFYKLQADDFIQTRKLLLLK
jgi:hypothetical protein